MASRDDTQISQILNQLHEVKFGEHTILILPDIYELRSAYAAFSKERLANNEAIMILGYYDNVNGVKHFLKELDVDVEGHSRAGSLIILDGLKEISASPIQFLSNLAITGSRIKSIGKTGISVIIDMGLFFHGHQEELLEFEKLMPVKADFACKSLLCIYHAADFKTLSAAQQEEILRAHDKKIEPGS